MKLVWHYAPWATLPSIVAAGALVPGNATEGTATPLLWFSARQDWDPSATKFVRDGGEPRRMTLQEHRRRFGCIRFGVPGDDRRLISWAEACRAAGTNFTERRRLEAAFRQLGANPAEWSAMTQPAPLVGLRFQVQMEEEWGEADMSAAARLWTERRG